MSTFLSMYLYCYEPIKSYLGTKVQVLLEIAT